MYFHRLLISLAALGAVLAALPAAAQQTQCAEVQVEIVQELTFERQGFDARMRINNGLPNTPLEQVNIEIIFEDEFGNPVTATTNPNSTTETFFYRVDSLQGIGDISGSGTVQPASFAEIHWLLVPTYGAAGGSLSGKRYFVGARLTYVAAGQSNEVLVTPDFITVRPQPRLELDYFLPIDVRADNPLTPAIEPAVPFTLGVRIKNTGLAPSPSTRIESSQPQIVENQQNLLINFVITGSYIDEEPAAPTLLLDFGNIAAGAARVGRWVMESTLAGQFVSFTADWTHSDDLGGRLTSLLAAVRAHRLIRDVLVDLPGRDTIRDFLALQSGSAVARLFESEGLDSPVTIQPLNGFGVHSQSGGTTTHFVDVPLTSGAGYLKVSDPYQGAKVVTRIVRQSDARELPVQNCWFSVEGTGPTQAYYFNLFDVNGGGRYLVDVAAPSQGAAPPTMQFIPNYLAVEGQPLSFVVLASDPNNTIPSLSVDSLPLGATFTDTGNGSGVFTWPTAVGQAGHYPVTFRASDGALTASRTPTLRIAPVDDIDDDGMKDAWELAHFGNLTRDGSGDLDGDGLSDLQEFLRGTDPTYAGNAPSVPAIKDPLFGKRVTVVSPTLVVENSRHGVEVPVYEFELFDDSQYTNRVAHGVNIPEGNTVTAWPVGVTLLENRTYFWRVRSRLQGGVSEWNYARFLVSVQNDPPLAPVALAPRPFETVGTRSPRLTVANAVDPDEDEVMYVFALIGFIGSQAYFSYVTDLPPGERGTTSWHPTIPANVTGPFFWLAAVYDRFGGIRATDWIPLDIRTVPPVSGAPIPLEPGYDELVRGPDVELALKGVSVATGAAIDYEVEVDVEPDFSSPDIQVKRVRQYRPQVSVQFSGLNDDTTYYWRVRAFDGRTFSPWRQSRFRVDLSNSEPVLTGYRNPFDNGRVDALDPVLEVLPVVDPEGQSLSYEWQVFSNPELTFLRAEGTSTVPRWRVTTPLTNHTTYFWRYRARDPEGLTTAWSAATKMFVSRDQLSDPPHIRLVSPAAGQQLPEDRTIAVRWSDLDDDSAAQVRFYINNVLVSWTFPEDPDGPKDDVWEVPPFGVPAGNYTLNVALFDGTTEYRDTTCCAVTVTPRSPTTDSDGDGVLDTTDNCPFAFNPSQTDQGGSVGAAPDGIGDACQCGDIDGNGRVTKADVALLRRVLIPDDRATTTRPELCDITGSPVCDGADAAALQEKIAAGQPVPQTCEAAQR